MAESPAIAMDPEGQRLVARLPELIAPGQPSAVLVTVFAVDGSAPRQPGARMLCRGGKLLAGTIGGGHLEAHALRDAAWTVQQGSGDVDDPQALATEVHEESDETGRTRRLCRYPLGSKLGQCCGGVVWLHFAEVDATRARQLAQELQSGQVVTRFADRTLTETPGAVPTVLLLGAGHVAAALGRCLQSLPWRVMVVDPRPEWADPLRFARHIEVTCVDPLHLLAHWGWLGENAQQSQTVARAAADYRKAHGRPLPAAPDTQVTYAIVMTWDHALDRDLTEALLGVGDRVAHLPRVHWVGLIGSKSKIASTHQRLRRRGVPDAVLGRLVAPIGLYVDGALLGGNLPGEIALSVAAQLLSLQPKRTKITSDEA